MSVEDKTEQKISIAISPFKLNKGKPKDFTKLDESFYKLPQQGGDLCLTGPIHDFFKTFA
jgi:hypothetical protein